MVVVMMFVIVVMSAAALLVMVVMMMLMIVVALFIMVMVMLVIMVMSAAALLIVIVVMMVLMLFLQKFICQGNRMLHNLKDLLAVQLLNWSSDDSSLLIDGTKKLHRLHSFLLIYNIGTAHDNSAGILYLVVKELAEVSHIHLAFLCIHYCGVAVQLDVYIFLNTLYSLDHVGKLTYA